MNRIFLFLITALLSIGSYAEETSTISSMICLDREKFENCSDMAKELERELAPYVNGGGKLFVTNIDSKNKVYCHIGFLLAGSDLTISKKYEKTKDYLRRTKRKDALAELKSKHESRDGYVRSFQYSTSERVVGCDENSMPFIRGFSLFSIYLK